MSEATSRKHVVGRVVGFVVALAVLAATTAVHILAGAAPAGAAAPTTIAVGGAPVGVRLSPDGSKAYVANFIGNSVSVIDTATGALSGAVPIGLGTNPFSVAVRPDGARLYVTQNSQAKVSVVDTTTNGVVATIPVGQSPRHVAFTPNGARAYVTNNGAITVTAINSATNAVVATIGVGANPAGLDISPDGARAYVALQGDNAVVVVNTATNTVVHALTVTGLGNPTGLALTPSGTKAYVTDYAGSTIRVLDTTTTPLTVVKTIAVSGKPYEVAVTSDGARAYVVDNTGNALVALDTSTDTVVGTAAVGSGPTDVAVAPDGSAVYVTNTSNNTVTVLRPPSITSAPTATFAVTQPASFTVIATGAPTPAFTTPASLPAWLTFTDNGNGTATLAGTPPSGSAGAYPFVLSASNVLNQDAQTFTLTVSKLAQAIAFTSSPPANAAVGGTYNLAATGGGSGNAVVFTVDPVSASVCSVSGAQVSFTAAGTCTINANQAGNADYNPAPTASQSVSLAKGAQAITFTSSPPANAAVGGSYDVAATGGPSGNPVVFAIDPSSAAVCALSGAAHVSFTAAGACQVNADQAGDSNYLAAPTVSQAVTVGKGAQSIAFTSAAPANAVVGGSYAVAATGGPSGNPVVFSVSPSSASVCTIAGASVSFVGAGTCVVQADQAGDANYYAAPTASQSVTVAAGAQTIVFTSTPPANAVVGGTYDVAATGGPSTSPVVFSIDAASAAVCVLSSGAHISFVAGGVCTIHADQAGDANYGAAPTASQTVTVAKLSQTILFTSTPPANAVVGGSYDVAATGGPSGNPVVFGVTPASASVCSIAGAHVSFAGAGSCVITANQAGSPAYNPALEATQSVSVAKGAQAITFTTTPPANPTIGGFYNVAATGGPSGNPVVFSVAPASAGVCSISGAQVSFTAAGVCVVNADQAGNANYNAAPTASQSASVAKLSQAITFTSTPPSSAAVGGSYAVAATGGGSGNPVVFTVAASSTSVCTVGGGGVTFTATGLCVVNADQAGNANYDPAPTVSQSVTVGVGSEAVWLKTFPAVRKPGKLPNAIVMRARLSTTTPGKEAIAGVTLTFTLRPGLTCTDATNNEGFASCSVVSEPTATIPSTYTVAFAGTNTYQEAQESGPVVPSATVQ